MVLDKSMFKKKAWMRLLLYIIREGCFTVTFYQKIRPFFAKFDISFQIFRFPEKSYTHCHVFTLILNTSNLYIYFFIFDTAVFDITHYKFLWLSLCYLRILSLIFKPLALQLTVWLCAYLWDTHSGYHLQP